MKKIVSVMLVLAMLFTCIPQIAEAKSGVKINKTSVTLTVGETCTLKIIGTNKPVTWSSSKPSIAAVNKNGKVTAKKVGTATITGKVDKKNYTCKVKVNPKKEVVTEAPEATTAPTVTETPGPLPEGKELVGIECLNVTANYNKKTDKDGKGDATLVNFGNTKYMLIDTGLESQWDVLWNCIQNDCKKYPQKGVPATNKYYFRAIVITHNHSDHLGNIVKLLERDDVFVEEIIFSDNATKNGYDKVKKAISGYKENFAKSYSDGGFPKNQLSKYQLREVELDSVNAVKIRKTKKNGKYYHKFKENGTSVKVVGPGKLFKNYRSATETEDANNSSMIVKIVGKCQKENETKEFRALILGDLYYEGLKFETDNFKNIDELEEIYNGDKKPYDFCKYGHHGYRIEGNKAKNAEEAYKKADQKIKDEIGLYNKYIHASYYVFTLSKARLTNTDYSNITSTKVAKMKRNYQAIVTGLKAQTIGITDKKGDYASISIDETSGKMCVRGCCFDGTWVE